jgi:hypothetical protein
MTANFTFLVTAANFTFLMELNKEDHVLREEQAEKTRVEGGAQEGGGGASAEDEGRETSSRIRIHVHVRDAAGDEEHHVGRSSGGKQ